MQHAGKQPLKRNGITTIEVMIVIVLCVVLLTLLIPAVSQSQEQSRRVQCANQLRNLAIGLQRFAETHGRFPASGTFLHDENLSPQPHQTWAVAVLPFIDQENLFSEFDPAKPLTDPSNERAASRHVPVFLCPSDISRSRKRTSDLSYAVNGGMGYTIRSVDGVRDCPTSPERTLLDLNGDSVACSGEASIDNEDRRLFKMLGLFFLETVNTDVTKRHHSLDSIVDGYSNTFLIAENVRTGHNPGSSRGGFADPAPKRCAFYIACPCPNASCSQGSVDYSTVNSGSMRINAGLWEPEGKSPIPNSFHHGGVNMAYADGRVSFLSETVDGAIYAALTSPQGIQLDGTVLRQVIVSEEF